MPDIPYSIREARRLIPEERRPDQRQDSTTDQVLTVLELARLAGCYDALDLLKRLVRENTASTYCSFHEHAEPCPRCAVYMRPRGK